MSDPAEDFGDFMRDIGRVPIATREQVDAFERRRTAERTKPAGLTDHERKSIAKQRLSGLEGPRRGQLYRHYKGGAYRIVSLSIDEATLEPLVTYSSDDHPSDIDTTRTLENFTEDVAVQGDGLVPRFRKVEGTS